MDEIIQKIIDFEKKAQSIVGEAREERQAYEETVRAEIDAYRDEINKEKDAEIARCIAQMTKETDESIKHVEDAAKLKIVQMHNIASDNKNEWIELLYNKIIGSEAE